MASSSYESPTRRTLEVVLYGVHIGQLWEDAGRFGLSYDAAYRSGAGSTPLSLSMPLSRAEHTGRQVEMYLSGLLPDSPGVRERWARDAGVRAGDLFGLLAAAGADSAGAAQFVPEAQLGDALAGGGGYDPVDDAALGARLALLAVDDGAWRTRDDTWSLSGAQGKFAVARTGEGWAVPRGFAPSTHIVKAGIRHFAAHALSEHVAMATLRRAGVRVATTLFATFDGQDAVVVERYDRLTSPDGSVMRLHQEDLCQALTVDPRSKYSDQGGPSISQLAGVVRLNSSDDSLVRFAQAVAAGYLVGMPDAHGKTFSLLLGGRDVQLAPMYGVTSGLVPDSTGALRATRSALSIGGENRFGHVTGVHWTRLARVVSLPPADVLAVVERLARQVPQAMEAVLAELPAATYGRDLLLEQVQPRVADVCARVLTTLADT